MVLNMTTCRSCCRFTAAHFVVQMGVFCHVNALHAADRGGRGQVLGETDIHQRSLSLSDFVDGIQFSHVKRKHLK